MARVKIGNVYPTDDYLLSRCAPAGYGLGGYCKVIDHWNNATTCGWYSTANGSPTAATDSTVWAGYVTVDPFTGQITQTINAQGKDAAYEAVRHYFDSTWTPWEWKNPPMEIGVEYRTTERWQGKPVYYKVVDFGGLPNETTATVSIGAENIEWAFLDLSKSWAGPASDITTNYVQNSNGITEMSVSGGKISITTNKSMTGTLAYITVKYTKRTG